MERSVCCFMRMIFCQAKSYKAKETNKKKDNFFSVYRSPLSPVPALLCSHFLSAVRGRLAGVRGRLALLVKCLKRKIKNFLQQHARAAAAADAAAAVAAASSCRLICCKRGNCK